MIRLVLLALLGCAGDPVATPPHPAPAAPADVPNGAIDAPLPGDSLYQLRPGLVDATGAAAALDVHRGHPVVVSMFYASCPSACPMLIADIQAFEAGLSDDDRRALRVLLVSLDPERDTPEKLAEVVERHALDADRWTLVRAEPHDVRAIAAALGIRYRPTGDGEMNHSSVLTLLDVDGRPVTRLEGLRRDAAPLRDALARARAGVNPQP